MLRSRWINEENICKKVEEILRDEAFVLVE
jgi:hypothetical protein